VCHTDVHLIAGGYDLGGGNMLRMKDRGISLPMTPGHEISGSIHGLSRSQEERGELRRGDRVVVYPWIGCGTCRKCISGSENVCERKPASLGIFKDGGYAEYVFVPHPRYLVAARGIPASQAAPLACSGLTAYSGVKRCALAADDLLVVIGAGGLGTTAIQLAKKTTGARVIVLDVNESKLDLATRLGADATIDTSGLDRKAVSKQISAMNAGRGADAVIDFVGNSSTSTLGFEILARGGRLVLVGLFGGSATLPLPFFPLKAAQILGNFTGTLRDLTEMVDLVARGVVGPVVSASYDLEDANDVLMKLEMGEIAGRAVLTP
jgi:D-arabinose 1-dehydrogenase-like Zn-dependent alcohol dehydrogenase